jgi:hypothetical protein
MGMFHNIPLYLYDGEVYYYQSIEGKSRYVNPSTFRILQDNQKSSEHYYSSTLEYKVHKTLLRFVDNIGLPKTSIVRQSKLLICPVTNVFPPKFHKVDFELRIPPNGKALSAKYRSIYIEAKGVITRDTLWILRGIEQEHKLISRNNYLMVFEKLPQKYPREFPKSLQCNTVENLTERLMNYVKEPQ